MTDYLAVVIGHQRYNAVASFSQCSYEFSLRQSTEGGQISATTVTGKARFMTRAPSPLRRGRPEIAPRVDAGLGIGLRGVALEQQIVLQAFDALDRARVAQLAAVERRVSDRAAGRVLRQRSAVRTVLPEVRQRPTAERPGRAAAYRRTLRGRVP